MKRAALHGLQVPRWASLGALRVGSGSLSIRSWGILGAQREHMNRSAVFALLSALALLPSCDHKKDDGGWTHERREWVHSLCNEGAAYCTCFVREVTTTVTYKEFVQSDVMGSVLGAAQGVCRLTASKD